LAVDKSGKYQLNRLKLGAGLSGGEVVNGVPGRKKIKVGEADFRKV
jgi:hypothetical protein